MKRTTVYLPPGLKAAVERAAGRRRVSEAEVIRDSIRSAVGGERPRPRGALSDLERACSIIERYSDQGLGVADASNVVLVDRYGTRRIAALDHRHFDVLRPLGGGPFTVVL
jgi:hypothetical protein